MESDLSFAEKSPYLARDLPKNPSIKSAIPTMVPSQPGPTISPPPSHCTTYLYQNHCNRFKEHPLNKANHHSSFTRVAPSSISPFPMIQTPSYKAVYTNGSQGEFISAQNPMIFGPNYNKMEVMHGPVDSSKGTRELYAKNLFQYGETSQSRVSLSVSQSLVYDGHPSVSVKSELQGGLSCNGGTGNNSRENNQGHVHSDQNRQNIIQNNSEIRLKDPNIIKGQWTANEDRYIKLFIYFFYCLSYMMFS
jgi:hypothetical protein